MKFSLMLCSLALAATLAAQEKSTWSGALADAACKQNTPTAACPVDAGTRSFGLDTADGFAPFDAAGNRQASAAVAAAAAKGNPTAAVSGTFDGGVLKVESVELK